MIPYDPAYNKRDRDDFFASREWKELRFIILKRDGFTCQACGARGGDVRLHVDHIVPVSVDWSKRMEAANLACICEDCNLGKGRQTVDYRKAVEQDGMVTLDHKVMNTLRTNGSFTRMTLRALGLREKQYRRPWYHTMIGRRIPLQQYQDALAGVGKTKAVLEREGHQEEFEERDGMILLNKPSVDFLRANGGFRNGTIKALGLEPGKLTVGWVQRLYGTWIPKEQFEEAAYHSKKIVSLPREKQSH